MTDSAAGLVDKDFMELAAEPGSDSNTLCAQLHSEAPIAQIYTSLIDRRSIEPISYRLFVKRFGVFYKFLLFLPDMYALDILSRAHVEKVPRLPTKSHSMPSMPISQAIVYYRNFLQGKTRSISQFVTEHIGQYHLSYNVKVNEHHSLLTTFADAIMGVMLHCYAADPENYSSTEIGDVQKMFYTFFEMSRNAKILNIVKMEVISHSGLNGEYFANQSIFISDFPVPFIRHEFLYRYEHEYWKILHGDGSLTEIHRLRLGFCYFLPLTYKIQPRSLGMLFIGGPCKSRIPDASELKRLMDGAIAALRKDARGEPLSKSEAQFISVYVPSAELYEVLINFRSIIIGAVSRYYTLD